MKFGRATRGDRRAERDELGHGVEGGDEAVVERADASGHGEDLGLAADPLSRE
jgi:hypothetical protein